MKVLVVSNMYPNKKYPYYGIFIKRFCEQLNNINIDYDKSIMYKKNSILSKISGYMFFYLRTIIKILLNNYDIIYVHYPSHCGIPILIGNKIKTIRVFTNVHGSDVVPENKKQEKFQKYTYGLLLISEKVIVPSAYFKEFVETKYKINPKKSFIYSSGGVSRHIFFPYEISKRKETFEKLKLSEEQHYIGFVGRITSGKGWRTFINAIEIIMERVCDVKFIIVGSGTEDKEMNAYIEQKKLRNIIIRYELLSQERLKDIYSILSVFVFPTERLGESLGLVALEAMACGVPVIASDFAAPKYYIRNGYNGYKFEKGNHYDLADKVITFLQSSKVDELRKGAIQTSIDFLEDNTEKQLKGIFKMEHKTGMKN